MKSPLYLYRGSKRSLLDEILPLVPSDTSYIVEPFAGSAALSCALERPCILGDVLPGLAAVWSLFALGLGDALSVLHPGPFAVAQREMHDAELFHRDMVRCARAFQLCYFTSYRCSLDRPDPSSVSRCVNWRPSFEIISHFGDYSTIEIPDGSFVYLDPPYHGTLFDYHVSFDWSRFALFLDDLSSRGIRWLASDLDIPASHAFYEGRGDIRYVHVASPIGRRSEILVLH